MVEFEGAANKAVQYCTLRPARPTSTTIAAPPPRHQGQARGKRGMQYAGSFPLSQAEAKERRSQRLQVCWSWWSLFPHSAPSQFSPLIVDHMSPLEALKFSELPNIFPKGCVDSKKSPWRPAAPFPLDRRAQRKLSNARLGPPIRGAFGGEYPVARRRRKYPNFGTSSTSGHIDPGNLCMGS